MSKPISKYEKEVMDRIDQIRVNQGYTMEDFSEYLGMEIEIYKRCKYKKIRVDLDFMHAVVQKFPADLDYILFGKTGQNYKLVNTFVSGTDEERAQVFEELARFCRDSKEMKDINAERLRRKAREKYEVDYVTKAGLVEKTGRKSSQAAVKKAAEKVAADKAKKKTTRK